MTNNRFFVEYGVLQEHTANGPMRVIECTTSSLDAVKITEDFARQIAEALNRMEQENLSPKMREAKAIREMDIRSPMARAFQDALATDLEDAARREFHHD